APFPVLRRSGLQANGAGLEVDLLPPEPQHLTPDPPPCDVHEGHDGLRVCGQVTTYRLELSTFEEPAPDVVLFELLDPRSAHELLADQPKREHPLERSQLSVDGRVRCALALALRDVRRHVGRGHMRRTAGTEDGEEVLEAELDAVGRPVPVGLVVVAEILSQLGHGDPVRAWDDDAPFLGRALTAPKQALRLALVIRLARLTEQPAVGAVLQPPDRRLFQ